MEVLRTTVFLNIVIVTSKLIFNISLLINLFIPLVELKNIHSKHQIKKTDINLKQIK